MSSPIWMAHLDHTGTILCQHEHRTRSGAARCLPKLPRKGTYLSFARIVPCNEAARQEELQEEEEAARQEEEDKA